MLGAVRLVVAAAIIFATAYVLSWQLLWGGMAGSEAPFHLHLIEWVAQTFPNLSWWYPWDAMGVSYREGYPLASHWLAVAASRVFGTDLEGGGQVVQFAVMPLTAIGIYGFFDWRVKRPLTGLVAGLLFLLSPIGWVELTHFGHYASWVGMVLLMPALIALDAFFFAWLRSDRSWRIRAAAVGFIVFTSLLGLVSPHLLAAPLIVAPAYGLALPRASSGRAWRWVLTVVPPLYVGVALLSAVWLGGELQYLAVVRSHWAGAGSTLDLARLDRVDLGSLLSLHPLASGNVGDLFSVSSAVLIPAVLGSALAFTDGRARMFLGLAVLGVALLLFPELYGPLFAIPGFHEFGDVAHRPPQLLVSVAAPALAALGLFELPRLVFGWAAKRWRWRAGVRLGVAVALPAALLVAFAGDVYAFSERVDGGGRLAYGPSLSTSPAPAGFAAGAPDLRDIWQHHPADVCLLPGGSSSLCSDRELSANFSIGQLVLACRPAGQTRQDAPVCRGLQLDDPLAPRWSGGSTLIADTIAWCQGRTDPVCDARYLPLSDQLLDPGQWRPLAVACSLDCPQQHQLLAGLGSIFPSPPQRAELNAYSPQLDMAFHTIVGGGITHSYNDQVIPSRELAAWMEQSMLQDSGVTAKSELSAALGVDAVVLSTAQSARAADYVQMGWQQVGTDPIAFVNPNPSGLAAQWNDGTAVLVIGGTQASVPALYNFVFERATTGLLPFSSAWLVRGTSPYIDDYTPAELSRFAGVIVLGYQYHDQNTAWSHLSEFVQGGGRLFVETGWQYVDPDWNIGAAPAALPVPSLQWGALDPSAPVTVDGTLDSKFGQFKYQGGAWGASSATSVRPGATELVTVGGRVVAARWQLGSGRVVWSGMNLIAHDASSGSATENQFVAAQFAWLFPPSGSQIAIQPSWNGDSQASLQLRESAGPTLVLFKESLFPGWSARLVTPAGSRDVPLVGSEMDFMLARLDSVPAGSSLVFSYGPTIFEQLSWGVSVLCAIVLIGWLIRPRLYAGWGRVLTARAGAVRSRTVVGLSERAGRWGEAAEDDEGERAGPSERGRPSS
jgi:6-pyruvoyl-tetrahydropterin synthase related domain